MRAFPKTLQTIIAQSALNLNQISQASGVSNPYLAKLIRGQINRPGKDKVSSILLALNFTITEIDKVLAGYDYRPLQTADIGDILKNNRARKIVGGNLPYYDHVYNDLRLVVFERLGGRRTLVKERPSGVFMPNELYLMKEYPNESNTKAADFRYQLTEALLKERKMVFLENLKAGQVTETFICKMCFERFIDESLSPDATALNPHKSQLVIRYLANALSLTIRHPNSNRMLLMERCPYFLFLLQEPEGEAPKVTYPGRKLHIYNNESDKKILEGFTTDLPQVIAHFRHEIEVCREAVPAEVTENYPQALMEFTFTLLKRHGKEDELKGAIDHLMQSSSFEFY